MRIFFAVCAVLGACFVLAAQTTAQSTATQAPALVGTATNGPTTIRAHNCEIHLKSGLGIYREDVHVDNPQHKLTCELLTVEAPKLDVGKFNRATAETNVVIDWTDPDGSTNHAIADKAVYTYTLTNTATAGDAHWETNAIVVLTGNPVVSSLKGRFEGDPIIWNRITDVITSPNFHEMKVNTDRTNSTSLFDTTAPAPKPAKPAK